MGRMFLSVAFLLFVCVCANPKVGEHAHLCLSDFFFFPGQRSHVLYIDVIKFTTHRPGPRRLSGQWAGPPPGERNIYSPVNEFGCGCQTG